MTKSLLTASGIPSEYVKGAVLEVTYTIVPITDGTFELFKQIDGKSVRTMGNYKSEGDAERVKKGLETGAAIKIETKEDE